MLPRPASWASAVALAAAAHRATSGLLDLVDKTREGRPAETTATRGGS